MVLVSHRKKFIFLKTSKTASTSVESYFDRYCLPEGGWEPVNHRPMHEGPEGIIGKRGEQASDSLWWNHMPASLVKERLPKSMWEQYFKFTVVRNPYDKLISAFYFFKSLGHVPNADNKEDIPLFREWFLAGATVNDTNKYLIEGEICVDFFIRYETLHQDIIEVCNRLDIPYEADHLPNFKSGIRNTDIATADFFDKESIERVKRVFAFEIENFGYSFFD